MIPFFFAKIIDFLIVLSNAIFIPLKLKSLLNKIIFFLYFFFRKFKIVSSCLLTKIFEIFFDFNRVSIVQQPRDLPLNFLRKKLSGLILFPLTGKIANAFLFDILFKFFIFDNF